MLAAFVARGLRGGEVNAQLLALFAGGSGPLDETDEEEAAGGGEETVALVA